MGFYTKYIIPRLVEAAMKNPDAMRLREAWVPKAQGRVLEIGIGSGLNLPYYSREVQKIFGVDPSFELERIARGRVGPESPEVEFLCQRADERLPFDDASMDTLVMTWTLCSIPNPGRALEEMRRVLRPDGRLIFIEHGRAPDARIARWQDRLTPFWERFTSGCHLNRKADELIQDAGFEITDLKTSYLPGPRIMTYTYEGLARASSCRKGPIV